MMTANELYEKVVALISEGETENAILLLKKSLQEQPHLGYYNEIVILTGQYNNWEKKRIRGLVTEESEFNRINSELLDVVEKIRRKEAEAKLAKASPKRSPAVNKPAMDVSPDPLRVGQNYQPPAHPRLNDGEKAGFGGQLGTYFKGFLIITGVIFLIAFAIEMLKMGPNEPTLPPPVNKPTGTITSANDEEPLLSLDELRAKVQSQGGGNTTFSPSDVRALNTSSLQQQLGSTEWFDETAGHILFSEDGSHATYYDDYGQVYIQGSTNFGAFVGVYQNTYEYDFGTVFITPPGNGNTLKVSYTSSRDGSTGVFSAIRQ